MSKKRYSEEEIITKLREVEVNVRSGETMERAIRNIGVTNNTYYKWRKKYGGLELNQAKQMKEMEKENARLKKLVADLSLDNAILKEANEGKY